MNNILLSLTALFLLACNAEGQTMLDDIGHIHVGSVDVLENISGKIRTVRINIMEKMSRDEWSGDTSVFSYEIHYNAEGDIIFRNNVADQYNVEYTYDMAGKKTRAICHLYIKLPSAKGKDRDTQYVVFNYHDDGRLLERITYNSIGGSLLSKEIYQYDTAKKLCGMVGYDSTGIPMRQERYVNRGVNRIAEAVLDLQSGVVRHVLSRSLKEGSLLEELNFPLGNDESCLAKRCSYRHNNRGDIIDEHCVSADGHDSLVYEYQYDKHGNWIIMRVHRSRQNAGHESESWEIVRRSIVYDVR
jgi:hypothetical protein